MSRSAKPPAPGEVQHGSERVTGSGLIGWGMHFARQPVMPWGCVQHWIKRNELLNR